MQFSKNLFWDVDLTNLDPEKHTGFIIPRVLMRGDLNDIHQLFAFYGKERIEDIVLQTRYLDKITLSFAANLFNIPKDQFRCFKLDQSTPQLWNY